METKCTSDEVPKAHTGILMLLWGHVTSPPGFRDILLENDSIVSPT